MPRIKITVIAALLGMVIALSFSAGYVLAPRGANVSQGLDIVAQAWDIIFDRYVDKDKLDAGKLSQAAIKGMVSELGDPYTYYLSAEEYQLGMSSLEGRINGIGAEVAVNEDKQLVIIAPVAGSPAEKAGIKPGDIIVQVNGRSVSDMSPAEAILTIRGAKGTSVLLLVQHQGETDPVAIEIVRGEIELPSVRFEMKGDIAYINITYFSDRTDAELSPVLQSITQQGASGIILDLRNNPGGLLEAVIDVASHFIRQGVLVSVKDNQGRSTVDEVKSGKTVTDLPMIVLVNSYSASGSEVLAGALQDYSRAIIAGTKTFGKGSVGLLYRFRDGSGLSITMARWLTPGGRLIEGKGLVPDEELELSGEDAIKWAIDQLHSRPG